MSRSCEKDISFMLTKDKVLTCANELGIPKEQVTEHVIESLKARVSPASTNWPEVVKFALS